MYGGAYTLDKQLSSISNVFLVTSAISLSQQRIVWRGMKVVFFVNIVLIYLHLEIVWKMHIGDSSDWSQHILCKFSDLFGPTSVYVSLGDP